MHNVLKNPAHHTHNKAYKWSGFPEIFGLCTRHCTKKPARRKSQQRSAKIEAGTVLLWFDLDPDKGGWVGGTSKCTPSPEKPHASSREPDALIVKVTGNDLQPVTASRSRPRGKDRICWLGFSLISWVGCDFPKIQWCPCLGKYQNPFFSWDPQ